MSKGCEQNLGRNRRGICRFSDYSGEETWDNCTIPPVSIGQSPGSAIGVARIVERRDGIGSGCLNEPIEWEEAADELAAAPGDTRASSLPH